jgi:hypothetical protein
VNVALAVAVGSGVRVAGSGVNVAEGVHVGRSVGITSTETGVGWGKGFSGERGFASKMITKVITTTLKSKNTAVIRSKIHEHPFMAGRQASPD